MVRGFAIKFTDMWPCLKKTPMSLETGEVLSSNWFELECKETTKWEFRLI